jgi:hypothetical protein
VHERGARHLADPSAAARERARLYGDDMDRCGATFVAVPGRPTSGCCSGGETVPGGFEVAYTPATPHTTSATGTDGATAFVGDVAGVRDPPSSLRAGADARRPTSTSRRGTSRSTGRAWRPERLAITHFGASEDAAASPRRDRAALDEQAELAHERAEEFVSRAREPRCRAAEGRPIRRCLRARRRRSISSTPGSSATGENGRAGTSAGILTGCHRPWNCPAWAARGVVSAAMERDRPQRRPQHLRPRRRVTRARDSRPHPRATATASPTRSTTRAAPSSGAAHREAAEHYWEQLRRSRG